MIGRQGPITLQLAALSFAWSLLVGVTLGAWSGLTRGRAGPALERTLSGLAVAVPAFLVGTLLISVLALRAGLVPTSGWDGWRSKILPVLTLGLVPMAFCSRLTRSAVRETLGSDFVRAARAKGLRRRVVAMRVLRNSLVPVVSAAGPLVGATITTLFVVEHLFAVPGLARHYVSAATARDYPLLMGMTVALTLVVVLVNLLADLALPALDPRVRDARL